MPSPIESLLNQRPLALACGMLALPPTVRHVALLEMGASPYIVGGKVGVGDFVSAVCVLTRGAEELASSGGVRYALATGKGTRAEKVVKFYAARPDVLKADTAALAAFVEDAHKGYRTKRRAGKGGGASALSFAHSIHVLLRAVFGMTAAEAWRYPMKSAIMDIQALNEMHGAKGIISESTAALLDRIAADRAAKGGQP